MDWNVATVPHLVQLCLDFLVSLTTPLLLLLAALLLDVVKLIFVIEFHKLGPLSACGKLLATLDWDLEIVSTPNFFM
jgi:hypothetical protein